MRQQESDVISEVESVNGLMDPSKGIRYPPRVEVLQQGRLGTCVFFILSGMMKLVHLDQKGREVILALRGPGWIIGASALILNEPNDATAATVTSCQLVRLNAEEFAKLVKTDLRFSEYLHLLNARDIKDHITHLVDMVCLSALDRLRKFLSEVVNDFGLLPTSTPGDKIVPLKQWEIAELLGITPEHLSRLLKVLESKGVIHRRGKLVLSHASRAICSAEVEV
jgi:CRP/FNR family cyclic AMP-dependent transcriptional regulator